MAGGGSMTGWWAERTPRERALLLAAAGLALVWGGVALVWQPLVREQAALTERIARHERAIATLSSAPATEVPVTNVDPRPVNTLISETAGASQLVIRRLEMAGTGAQLVLDDAPFDTVILWLDRLERDHGLRVAEIDLTRRPAPGVVSARMRLER